MVKKTRPKAAVVQRQTIKEKADVVVKEVVKESPRTERGEEGIDIVVPMVFPTGSTWLESYKDACEKTGRKAEINERYRSWDLERYFFRGIAKNMPFVRKIHLILSDEGQIPFWIDKSKVHVVLHKDIMPKELLPTFNSSAIEMWLHKIEGLSETFIYCNDDMIATSPLTAEDFFLDGKPVTHCEKKVVGIVGSFMHTCKNSLNMAAADHEVTFGDNELLRDGHSYAPMLLSVVKETASKHCEAMRHSCTQFRDEKNLNQYLYTYEQWLGGKCVNGSHAHRYFSISSSYNEMEEILLSGTAGVACFNDAGIGDWMEMRRSLYKVMQKMLGEKCAYEV